MAINSRIGALLREALAAATARTKVATAAREVLTAPAATRAKVSGVVREILVNPTPPTVHVFEAGVAREVLATRAARVLAGGLVREILVPTLTASNRAIMWRMGW